MKAPSKPCAAPGCRRLTVAGRSYCDACAPKREQARQAQLDATRRSASKRGYDRRWRKIAKATLAREPLCRRCAGLGVLTRATDVDHIVPKAQGGTDQDDNLQPLCHACHSGKTWMQSGPGATRMSKVGR